MRSCAGEEGGARDMDPLKRLYLESIGVHYLPCRPQDRTAAPDQPLQEFPADLQALRRHIGDCRRCPLAEGRRNLVFGTGSPEADLVFVGEAPGKDEDLKGEPFVGKAGQLLTRIINAMGLGREDVYICNVIKCRPPGNRDPLPEEVAQCEPFLKAQLDILRPRIICALGSFAARALIGPEVRISKVRGRLSEYNGIPLIPTYHPSFLLRNPGAKREVWEDVQKIMQILGLPDPRGQNP
ncbi:MAG: uracil-DNA glycosylase [bacterium]|nr:MAG: uracil-DNA glycosylase [bacterium]